MSHDKYLRGPASLVNKETEEPEDDLTISYLYGYNKGKDFSLAENKRLQDVVATLQRAGIMGVDTERLLVKENKRLREALETIVPISKRPYMDELITEIAEQALKGDE